jgi:hypothetical protein
LGMHKLYIGCITAKKPLAFTSSLLLQSGRSNCPTSQLLPLRWSSREERSSPKQVSSVTHMTTWGPQVIKFTGKVLVRPLHGLFVAIC